MKHMLLLFLIVLMLSACNAPANIVPSPTGTTTPTLTETFAPEPTSTTTPEVFEIITPDPSTVVLDFVAAMCTAEWSNNGEYLDCPGDPNDTGAGYVDRLDNTIISGDVLVNDPSLITIPAYESFSGIFGHYPAMEIWDGDTFHAVLACKPSAILCNVEFGLSYFDVNGTFHDLSPDIGPQPISDYDPTSGAHAEVEVDLSALTGQTIELVLVVRTKGDHKLYNPIWISPYIQRDPDAQQPVPVAIATATTSSAPGTSSGIPGTISGWVDLSTAPPYLKPSFEGGHESPVVVMFFNLDDGTWWWFHTTATHPYYQMTVPPGNYQVVAYARGIGVPYITGAYTGYNPSCGNELKTVTVPPNGSVENIVISDWICTCNSNAYRPAKPDSVPLP